MTNEAADILRKAKERFLDLDEQAFLEAIEKQGGHASRKHLPAATRSQDHTRSRLKRDGYAKFVYSGWKITDAGRAALAHTRADRAIALAEAGKS